LVTVERQSTICQAGGIKLRLVEVLVAMQARFEDYRRLLRQQLPLLQEHYHVDTLELFGSHVRGDARADSDLDVLVSFGQPPSLFRLVEMEQHLSDVLGVKVDLVLRDSLKPAVGRRILAEAAPL
jgi:predicted nucleotidyltransferase